MAQPTEFAYQREPYLVAFEERALYKETYAGQTGMVVLESQHLKPQGVSGGTVVISMHPIGGTQYLPLPAALARAGVPVICCNSRYPRNDSALIMEKVVLDLGACVRHAKEKLGYERVVLLGWSGGGALSAFYQAEAESPSMRTTPAGDPPDLTQANLERADGVMMMAAHGGRASTLTEWIDPSIMDESRPFERDPELNLYDPANPHRAPYSAEYLARFRAAQVARNRRISDWALAELDAGRRREGPSFERCFVVHGTMADPRWLDGSIDPNERKSPGCFMGDPRLVNDGPAGLARFCTLRSWLSQWSLDHSNADGVAALARVSVPVLMLECGADDGCTPHHVQRFWDAVRHDDRERHLIRGANHYFFGQKDKVAEAAGRVVDWLRRKGFMHAA
ncbi:MAG: alpha/beta fold hydrolase [Burkholderiales bacterium]|nr:alpha/beta fold hydrolase [Burkholderiales bacterium]